MTQLLGEASSTKAVKEVKRVSRKVAHERLAHEPAISDFESFDGRTCGGTSLAKLEDGTKTAWPYPEKEGAAACVKKCRVSASCQAFSTWKGTCYWVKDTWRALILSHKHYADAACWASRDVLRNVGLISLKAFPKCLQSQTWNAGVTTQRCKPASSQQNWRYDESKKQLQLVMGKKHRKCLSVVDADKDSKVRMKPCSKASDRKQQWEYDIKIGGYRTVHGKRCLTASRVRFTLSLICR